MKAAINKFSAVICLLGWSLIFGVVPAWSQAALLPNAKQTFFDQNGNPLSNGKVFSYVPNTQVPKTTWSNSTEGASNANPVILDAAGRAVIYGQGDYQQTVTDAANNQQWSALTTAYGSSQPSGSNGTDTAPVGTVMAWAGFTAPTNWAFAYGQTMSRTTFAALMAVITLTNATTSCVNTSTTISGLADTSQIPVGAPIEASCLPVGTTVSSISSGTSVVVSQAATLTGTVSSTIFPWGNGNGTSTFTAPDLRGRTMAGADAMGGVAASRLTSTFYGASAATPAVGGGAQSRTASTTLATGNIPQFTFTPSGTIGNSQTLSNIFAPGGASNFLATGGSGNSFQNFTINGSSFSFTGNPISIGNASPSAAASAAFATVQPTLTVNYIIKVAANTTGLGGVTSLGGMFGDIVCASTLTCAPVGSPAVNTIGCITATPAQIGCVEPDGTSITIVNGKITAIASVASIAVGTTVITGATGILQNNAGILNSLPSVGTGSVVLNTNSVLSGTLALTGNQSITWNGSVTNSLNLNTPGAGQLANLGFQSNGVTKWSIFKDAADAYNVFDVAGSRNILQAVSGGNLALMPGGGCIGVGSSTCNPLSLSGTVLDVVNSTSTKRAFMGIWNNVAPTSSQIYGQITFLNGASPSVQAMAILSRSNGTTAGTGDFEVWTSATSGGISTANFTVDPTGNTLPFGNLYVGGGRPWVDVRSGANGCAAAVGDGSTNDQAAIQCQITWVTNNIGAGEIKLPCGNYKVGSTLVVAAPIALVGEGRACSVITTAGADVQAIRYAKASAQVNGGGFRNIEFVCELSSAAATNCVEVDNLVNATFENFGIIGGNWALYICGDLTCAGGVAGGGADNVYRNGIIDGYGSGGGGLQSHNSANWFYDMKIDALNTTGTGVYMNTDTNSVGSIQESDFFRVDMSGAYSSSAFAINDSSAARSTVVMFHPIFGATVGFSLGTFKSLSISGGELGTGTYAISSGRLQIAASMAGNGGGGAITFTGGTTRNCAANDGVTC